MSSFVFSARLTEAGLTDLAAHELVNAAAEMPSGLANITPSLIREVADAIRRTLREQDADGA